MSTVSCLIDALPNDSGDRREATVTLMFRDIIRTVSVVQSAKATFDFGVGSAEFYAEGGEYELNVTTNVPNLDCDAPEWLTVSREEMLGAGIEISEDQILGKAAEYTYKLSLPVNTSRKLRSGDLVFKNDTLGQRFTLKVSQEGHTDMARFTTSATDVYAPVFEGSDLSGSNLWGDGSRDAYTPGAKHHFKTKGDHTVSSSVNSSNSVTINDLSDISEIDFTLYY